MIVTMKKRVTAKHKVVNDRRKDVHIFYQQQPPLAVDQQLLRIDQHRAGRCCQW